MGAFLIRHPLIAMILLVIIACALQFPLVAAGHPVAVWLWCDLAHLCRAAWTPGG